MASHTARRVGSLASALVVAFAGVYLSSAVVHADVACLPGGACTVNLIAAPLTKAITLPDGQTVGVPMWGFAHDADGDGVLDPGETPTVPGPRIVVQPGTGTLTITVTRNLLPQPVSIMIPGQRASGTPVTVGGRVRSMAPETAPGGSGSYLFTGLKPGTFLYESATHPAVQVQMGLYGAVTQDAAAGQAYAGVPYDGEVLQLYSEIDVHLHQAIATGTYGSPSGPTSTIDYVPAFFLVNGQSYTPGDAPVPAGAAGGRVLVRMLNAGLISHTPVLDNGTLVLVAEDGNKFQDAHPQAAVLLAAGKTHDAIWTPAAEGDYALYDRMLRLEAATQSDGGMLTRLHVAAAGGPSSSTVTAVPDSFNGVEDTPLSAAAPGVLGNDTGATAAVIYSQPRAGTLTLNPNGSFLYTPSANFSGYDSFSYRAMNASDTSAPTEVVLALAPQPDPPTALPVSTGLEAGSSQSLTLTGIDPDNDPLTFYVATLPAAGNTLTVAGRRTFAVQSVVPVGGTARITTTTPHGLTTGQWVTITGATTEPSVDGNQTVTVTGATTFTVPIALTTGQVVPGGVVESVFRQVLTAAQLFGQPGQLAVPGGALVYTPAAGGTPFTGSDGFTFVVSDGSLTSAPAAAAITVRTPTATAAAGTPITLQVVDPAGAPIPTYRWTLEEDRTYEVIPGVVDPNTPSVGFHRSYMPVVQSGDETTSPRVDSTKRYFVSVLPKGGGYSNSGAEVGRNQSTVTVVVTRTPMPTAQVRVRVFQDTAPLNGQYDSDELPLAGFAVGLDDAGGRYGMAGGQMFKDAYDNPLGTTYRACTDPGGCDGYEVDTIGNGFLVTDAEGFVTFQNLPPGKFTVKVIPPADRNWIQTTTIEGQKGQDAWVKNNEPTFFTEFGPAGPHVEIGFVQPTNDATVLNAGPGPFGTITGSVTMMHMSRPPNYEMFSGAPFDYTRPWVGLNTGVNGAAIYAQPTDEDGNFSIEGVPSGTYTLVVWDSALDVIIASKTVEVNAPTTVALGDVPVFPWFTRLYHYVFEDLNHNGQRDPGERGIREVTLNTRWRDATIYQSSATDGTGFLPFEETFPFFAWQIAEVDYSRFRATGVTVVVDNGGNVATNTNWPDVVGAESDSRVLSPQPQTTTAAWGPNEAPTNGGLSRTETGPALLEGFQGFIGQTNVFLWGKAPYDVPDSHPVDVNVAPFDDFPGPGDTDWNANGTFDLDEFHGGITGIVHYSTTRAENNPRWGTPEPWEPGIAGVTVQLWDETRTHLLNEYVTDSWDDSLPTGCQGQTFVYLGRPTDCYDGLRNFNQVRPAVFDGGFAFYTILGTPDPAHPGELLFDAPLADRTMMKPLPAGRYVVKVVVPPGYTLVKEEDKNVDFGEEYIPQQFLLTGYDLADAGAALPADAQPREHALEDPIFVPFCVGSPHEVPSELSLFPGVPATYAGDQTPLCDEKLLDVRYGTNAAANFFLYTEAPIAGHIIGFVLDDLANEFDRNSPQFGEKYAPPFLPVSIRDWTGREIAHTYTDRNGVYNALVPSTFTAATPIPSGMTPSMLTACINSPLKAGAGGALVPDPFFDNRYSQFCYTLQYMPGTTTYLDTPVVPTSAFTGPGQSTLDAELPDHTPIIASVTGPNNSGPYVVSGGTSASRTIVITSAGSTQVPNPAYDGITNSIPTTITRDYGFGAPTGQVFVDWLSSGGTIGSTALPVLNWTDGQITAVVPSNTPSGELRVVRGAGGLSSVLGVAMTVATPAYHAAHPPHYVAPGGSIQEAIDAASTQPGDLVIVPPGTYEESVVMHKPVRLQGWGAPSTIINAAKTPAEKMQAWRDKLSGLFTQFPDYLSPFQATEFALGVDQTGELLGIMLGGEGAGVTVLGRGIGNNFSCPPTPRPTGGGQNSLYRAFGLQRSNGGGGDPLISRARIDGFGITGSDQAAGIEVNDFACNTQISNNRIFGNMGDFAGGIKIGHPGEPVLLADENAHNDGVEIAFNHVTRNGTTSDNSGGAIAIGTGAPGYRVERNVVVGNITQGWGAGIAHMGASSGGTIDRNVVVFNESFSQSITTSGGGIFVGGRPPLPGELTPGAGNVVVSNNLVQGNSAAGGDGGGIALAYVNGQDVARLGPPDEDNPDDTEITPSPNCALGSSCFRVDIFGNTIVNNLASLAGGGISLQDAVNVRIIHNTIAHNDSLAVAGAAFGAGTQPTNTEGESEGTNGDTAGAGAGGVLSSAALPSGIVSRGHSPQLAAVIPPGRPAFSDPQIVNSVVWQNRSFRYGALTGGVTPPYETGPAYGLIPVPGSSQHPAGYWDFGVLGGGSGAQLSPTYSVVTSTAGVAGNNNVTTAPLFLRQYFNGDRRQTIVAPELTTAIQVPAALDEGGNFIRPLFGPLTLTHVTDGAPYGNYHVAGGVDGRNLAGGGGLFPNLGAVPSSLVQDLDGNNRLDPITLNTVIQPHRGFDQATTDGGTPPVVPTISVADASVVEGNSGTVNMNFVITLSSPTTAPVSVDWSTADDTALDVADYVGAAGTASFAPGVTTQTVSIAVKGDTDVEPNEAFFLNLAIPVNATIVDGQAVGTIVNDDVAALPTLSVNDVSVVEGNAGTTNLVFTVSLSATPTSAVTVNYATANGTTNPATAGTDYTAVSGTLTFAASTATLTQSVSVPVVGDTTVEPNETLFLNLTAPVNATIADGQGLGTILNDDGTVVPTLSVNDVSVVEGNAGTSSLVFTVTLSATPTAAVTVNYATANGTINPATAGSDYTAVSGTLTFAANTGALTQTVSVPVVGDTTAEPDETLFLNLTAPVNATLLDSQGLGTILNDDLVVVLPTLSVSDASVVEGNAGTANLVFTVTLSAPPPAAVTVNYATATGATNPATVGSDYTATSGTLTFAAGTAALTQTVSVPVVGDTTPEPNETLFLNLSSPVNATLFDAQGLGTILNDDGPVPESVVSSDGTGARTVTISTTVPGELLLAFVGSDGPGGGGQTVAVSGGGLTWTLVRRQNAQAGTAEIWRATAGGVLTNASVTSTQSFGGYNQSLTVVAFSGASGTGAANGASAPTGGPTVSLTTTQPGSLVWGVGEDWDRAVARTVPASQVKEHEFLAPSGDTFWVQSLAAPVPTSPTVATLNDTAPTDDRWNFAAVEIVSSGPPLPTLSVNDASVVEGNAGTANLVFTVTLSATPTAPVTVSYTTAPGTTNPATAGADYTTTSGALTFAANTATLTQTVTVPVIGDTAVEADETLFLNLSSPVNAVITDGQGVGTIVNDDTPPPGNVTISVADATVTEGNAGTVNLGFVVTLSGSPATTVTMQYATAPGTATASPAAGADYTTTSGTLTFAAGTAVLGQTVNVAVLGDTTVEPDETLFLNLSNPTGSATILDGQGLGTIVNDDVAGGLVAAFGFEETAGTTAADAAGGDNNGTIAGAASVAAGRFGRALSFSGTSASPNWVTVPDAANLDLTTAMTLSAWVRPTALNNDWRTVILKERGTGLAYALYAADAGNQPPAGYAYFGNGDIPVRGASVLPLNTWSHIAVTYGGTPSALRFYVNGVLVGTTTQTGSIAASGNPLRIGGNNVWGEFFSGLIDEVRVYNRALSAAEIQTDMNAPVVAGSPSQP